MYKPLFIGCVLLGFLTGNASANNDDMQPFHGVVVLSPPENIVSSSGGLSAGFDDKIGPYASDAVVMISYQGEMSYVGPHRNDRIHVVVVVGGKTEADRLGPASSMGNGPAAWPLTYYLGEDRQIFVPKGEVRTLHMSAKNEGDFDAAQAVTTARMHLTAVAAKD